MLRCLPFFVRSVLEDDDVLILGWDEFNAKARYLTGRHNIRGLTEVENFEKRGEITAERVRPLELIDTADETFSNPIYARSMEWAIDWAEQTWPERKGRIVAGKTDDVEVLKHLSPKELRDLAAYTWGNRADLLVHGRKQGGKNAERMPIATRWQIVYALRLSMLIEPFGKGKYFKTSRRGEGKEVQTEMNRKIRMHGENIGRKTIQDMYRDFGDEMSLYDRTQTMTIEKFCNEYGYDPHKLRWTEIAALWKGGPEGLKRQRVDNTMDGNAFFTHGKF